ncbi:MAG: hypothetical protein HYY28_12490 [Betaproteobacteria bacterium]|nr:hypothetical protein [Betaproteobacteria bacterium]
MNAPAAQASAAASLAERIFVELVGRAFLRVENAAVFKPDAAQLAKLSIELAAAFQKAETEHRAESGPKNVGYDLSNMDLASLGRK